MNTLFELPLELTKTLNILGGLETESSFAFYQRVLVNHRCSHALLHFLLCFCFVLFFDEPKIHKSFVLKNFHYSKIHFCILSSF